MVGLLAVVLLGMAVSLPRTLGKAKASKSFRELFAKTRSINLMAAARIFLFGSRDVWFVVGLPVFLYSQGWHYMEVAGFIASWTIGYGLVQAIAPSVIRRSADGLSREVPEARQWGAVTHRDSSCSRSRSAPRMSTGSISSSRSVSACSVSPSP